MFERYHEKVNYWITFNEINTATLSIGNFLSLGLQVGESEFINQPDNLQQRYQALHHQFVASAKVVAYGHEHYPDLKIGCMISYMPRYPYTSHPNDVLLAKQEENMHSKFCGDVQVTGNILIMQRNILLIMALQSSLHQKIKRSYLRNSGLLHV